MSRPSRAATIACPYASRTSATGMIGGFQYGWPRSNETMEASIQSAGARVWNSSFSHADERAAGTPNSARRTWFSFESAHWMKYHEGPTLRLAWLMLRPHTRTPGTLPAGPAGSGA